MQVNFNPNVNQVKPNFKASFANDASTKKVLENFIRHEKETTLATQFALEDIKTNDKISLRYDAKTGDCYAKNMTTTNEILLEDRQLSNPSKLYRAIVEEGFLNERLEGKKNYYLDKAIEFIKKQFSKEQEELNKLNYEYEKLLSDAEFESLKTKLENKLCADKDFSKENIADILERTNEQNIALAEKLCADKNFSKENIADILERTNEQNIALADKLCADKDFPKEDIEDILWSTNEQNLESKLKIYDLMKIDKDFPEEEIGWILWRTNEQNIALAEKLCADKDFPKERIRYILVETNEQNIALADKLCADKDFPEEEIGWILKNTNEQNIALADKLCADKDFPKVEIGWILKNTNEQNLESKLKIYDLMKIDKDSLKERIGYILVEINEQNIALAEKLCADKDFPEERIGYILKRTSEQNIALAEKLCADKDFPKEQIADILENTNEQNIALAEKLCADKDFPKENIANILWSTNEQNLESKLKIYDLMKKDKDFPKENIANILWRTNEQNIALAEKLCADKDFPKVRIGYILGNTKEQNIALAEKLCADKDFTKELIGYILESTNKQNIALAEKLYADKDFPKENIADILVETNKQNIALAEKLCADKDFTKENIADILLRTNKQNIALAEKLCADKNFSKENIADILWRTNKQNLESKLKIYDLMKKDKDFPKEGIGWILKNTNEQNIALAEKLYADKDFPKEGIGWILENTNEQNIALAEKLCADKDFTKERIGHILGSTNEQNIELAEKLCADKDFPIDLIANILKKTSPENIKLCTELCDTKDFPVETIPDFIKSVNKETEEVIRDMCYKKDFPKNMIGYICKSLRCINNESNVELLKQALVTKDLSPSVIAKLLDSSFIKDTGNNAGANQGHIDATKVSKFTSLLQNSKIAPYIVKLLNDGVDMDTASFLAKTKYQNKQTNTSPYLPKNHNYTDSQIEFANTLGQLGMNRGEIDALIKFASVNGEIDPQILGFTVLLLKNGFPLNMILSEIKSLWADETPRKVETKTPAKNIAGTRSRESVTGLERKLIDQYNPEPEIWRSEIETRKWAEEKYQSKKALEYISTYKAIDDPEKGLKVSQQRKETLAQWYEFLETDETARDNPFVKLIVIDAITRDLLPENTTLAPEFDKTIVKKILADAMNDSHNISLAKSYKNAIKAKNTAGNKGETIEVNGVKGTWFTVPQTDSSSPDFSFNVAKVKAYSDGTNWCIRSWNAGPYIQQGDMHFFVDEKGLTQVCIRENAPGVIAEIQQRQQNSTLPIPYIEVIDSYITLHKLNADNFRRDIHVALSKKPNFDKLKQEIQELYTSKNYKAIFEEMGIQVTVLEDGTWKLSHYMIDLEGFTLNDLGINENDLLSNVSQIAGNANFANSNATSIPRLRHVGGKFDFIGSKISDVRSLEEINGYKISWE